VTSLRRHLARTLLGSALVLGGVGAAVMYMAARDAAVDQFDIALFAKALAISTLTTPEADGVHVAFTDHFMRGFDDHNPSDFFEMWSDSGRPLARSESLGTTHLEPPKRFSKDPQTWSQSVPNGHPGRAIAFSFAPKVPGSRHVGPPVFLLVVSDSTELDEDLLHLIAIELASGAVLLGATFWLIPRALKKGLEPLERLGERAAAIDSRSLGSRFSVGDLPMELQPIAGRLNDLLMRIEKSFERERRFGADLAHELRTPLAELRALVECSLKWPETRDPDEGREILKISSQIESIVSHLLALARSDGGQLHVKIEAVAVDRITEERWKRLESRAASRGLTTILDLDEVTAHADPSMLRSILDNLFENAADYSSSPGRLRVSLRGEGAFATLTVENTCDLNQEDVSQLFERFWRKETARSDGRHVGLGLSLARAFAEAMGWHLTAAIQTPGFLTITLSNSTVRTC
jgi:signal transduction histidine kinase